MKRNVFLLPLNVESGLCRSHYVHSFCWEMNKYETGIQIQLYAHTQAHFKDKFYALFLVVLELFLSIMW